VALQHIAVSVELTSLSPIVDNASFQLHFTAGSTSPVLADVTTLMATIESGINSPASTGTVPPGSYIHQVVSRVTAANMMKAYDVTGHENGTPHGPPIATRSWTLGPTGAGAVEPPEGCCAVMTLQAPYGSDDEFVGGTRPRARDRGRFYFGPLGVNALAKEGTTNRTYLKPGFLTDFVGWGIDMARGIVVGAAKYWLCVWSRQSALFKGLANIWCDDRPDYQRRRVDQAATRYMLPNPTLPA